MVFCSSGEAAKEITLRGQFDLLTTDQLLELGKLLGILSDIDFLNRHQQSSTHETVVDTISLVMLPVVSRIWEENNVRVSVIDVLLDHLCFCRDEDEDEDGCEGLGYMLGDGTVPPPVPVPVGTDSLRSLPLYPTEDILWDSLQVSLDAMITTGERSSMWTA